jgi:hypothetical protein
MMNIKNTYLQKRHMDLLRQQMDLLNTQVDALYQMIERVDGKTSEILLELKDSTTSRVDANRGDHLVGNSTPYASVAGLESELDYKDVLVDEGYSSAAHYTGERSLSPDVQIQRLTAQLTAAYNRIAALEEQLLSRRVH